MKKQLWSTVSSCPPSGGAANHSPLAKLNKFLQRRLRLALPLVAMVIGFSPAYAQTISTPSTPAAADNLATEPKEPVAAGPLGWKLLGDTIYTTIGTDGLYHVPYALVFTNEYFGTVNIKSIEVLDPDNDFKPTGNNSMLSIKNQDITGQVRLFALPQTFDAANFSSSLGPGQAGVAYFDLTYPDRKSIPAHLSHRVSSTVVANSQTVDFVVIDDPLAVDRREPIVLHPPLRKSGWTNLNGCCRNLGAHRAAFNPINGTFWQAESYAIDFVKVNGEGLGHTGDGSQLDQYPYYGAEILAAKGGKVVEVVNDQPDQIPNTDPVGATVENAAGNHVIIEMAKDRYALYAHLKPYSATVQVGEIVADGQKIGLLGNSGNTTNPHLHFQVMDRPSPLKANGVPFVFDCFTLQGTVTDSVDGMGGKFALGMPLPIKYIREPPQNAMPLALDVLSFGDPAQP